MGNSYQQISYGSRGDLVKKLQERLNQNGYALDVDGSYGPKTQAAVRDYQQKNGLKVDGITGSQTWGLLTSTAQGAGQAPDQPEEQNAPGLPGVSQQTQQALDGYTQGYQPSEDVLAAWDRLQQAQANRPGEYQSQYRDQLQAIYDKIMNREPFTFDLNGNALYQQYKEQYQNLGKIAMMDTMGQAAGLTGGYGSSYGQGVGQQTYNSYLQQLNDVVPELYDREYQRYHQQGQALMNQYGLAVTAENQDYGRWQNDYDRWLAETQNAQNRYDADRSFDYSQWQAMLSYYQNQAAMEQEQANWQANMDLDREQWDYQTARSGGRGGSGSGGSSGGGKIPQWIYDRIDQLRGDPKALKNYIDSLYAGGNGPLNKEAWGMLRKIYCTEVNKPITPREPLHGGPAYTMELR